MPGGFVSGPGTLMDEMMRRAGLENAATRYGLTRTANLPLERVVADPPQILLSGEPYPGAPSWAERVMAGCYEGKLPQDSSNPVEIQLVEGDLRGRLRISNGNCCLLRT